MTTLLTETSETAVADPDPARRKSPAAVRYLGFRITEDGREYSLKARNSGEEPRVFVLLITHEAFSCRWARFQDGPGLCFEKLRRELETDPDLLPRARLVFGMEELVEYREAHEARPAKRRRRTAIA